MKRRDDPNQILIDWGTPGADLAVSNGGETSRIAAEPQTAPATDSPPSLIQRLPWDFATSFPQPTDEAIENGVLDETDREPENLRELHECHARQCLAALQQLDIVHDARRRGVDPKTGQIPRTHASRERLRKYLAEEPGRLEHIYRIFIETYESAFGPEPAAAFDKFVRARHAGIPVECDQIRGQNGQPPEPPVDSPVINRRLSSSLPVPRPLHSAVASGVFGRDERGKPIRPGPDEVRAITEQHAERMIEVAEAEIPAGISKYAEDFGDAPAAQLGRYVRRKRSDRSR